LPKITTQEDHKFPWPRDVETENVYKKSKTWKREYLQIKTYISILFTKRKYKIVPAQGAQIEKQKAFQNMIN